MSVVSCYYVFVVGGIGGYLIFVFVLVGELEKCGYYVVLIIDECGVVLFGCLVMLIVYVLFVGCIVGKNLVGWIKGVGVIFEGWCMVLCLFESFVFLVVVGFGGYLVLLVLFVVQVVCIFIVIYEQNVVFGWVNCYLLGWVDVIVIVYYQVDKFNFKYVDKVYFVGNLV